MNALSSECSSGCESGWTLYFDHSSSDDDEMRVKDWDLKKHEFGKKWFKDEDEQEEEEEDLSMVSDASSGPPIHYEAVEGADEAPRSSLRPGHTDTKRQKKIKRGGDEDFQSLLDDTASSPAITNHCGWKHGVEIRTGRRSTYQEQHYDELLHSPISGYHPTTRQPRQ
ncbi:hypothetical protein MLD38_032141 [Melastoma candidum]|uniref:Uncharacterized protein n=1 Tax=Melastoma candidum TaxID=119954 RepID=A0ACB9M3D1_9MYRT|nr:hypothetical protein MLD38_032141 [Melastoma candidum]